MRCSVIILEKEKQIYEKVDEERSLLLCYEGDGQTEEDVIFVENSQAFEGTIKEINSTSAVVEVDEGFPIRSSGDRVSVTLDEAAALAQVGDRVRVTYSRSRYGKLSAAAGKPEEHIDVYMPFGDSEEWVRFETAGTDGSHDGSC